MYTDRIDLSIPQEDLESVLAAIASATATLEFLPLLNPSDRKHLAKLGLKNEGLARTIIEVGRAHPGLIPRDIDFEQVDRDLLARDQLWNLRLVLQNLLGRIDGALMLTGVDLYAAALEMYHCLRRKSNRPELRDIVDDLKKGFSRPSRKKKEQELQPAATTVQIPAPAADQPREAAAAQGTRDDTTLTSFEPATHSDAPATVPAPQLNVQPPPSSLKAEFHRDTASYCFPYCGDAIFSGGTTPSSSYPRPFTRFDPARG